MRYGPELHRFDNTPGILLVNLFDTCCCCCHACVIDCGSTVDCSEAFAADCNESLAAVWKQH